MKKPGKCVNCLQLANMYKFLSQDLSSVSLSLCVHFLLGLDLVERSFVMPRDDTTASLSLKLLEPLSRSELREQSVSSLVHCVYCTHPSWMIAREPPLWDAVSPVLNNVAMVADKQESTAVRQVQLHANQAISMAWKMMQGYALTEIKSPLVEGLPVTIRGQLSS